MPVTDGLTVILTSAKQRIAEGQGIPHEEFWRGFLTPWGPDFEEF